MTKTRQKPDDRKQLAAFRKAAREVGADATDEQFQDALRRIAKHKPSEKGEKRHTNRERED